MTISLSISAFDIMFLYYLAYFFFLIVFQNFFAIALLKRMTKQKRALIIPTGAPITVANESIKKQPLVADKTINILSKSLNRPI